MDNTIDCESTLSDQKWNFHLFLQNKIATFFDNHCCELLIYVILTPLEKIKEGQIDSCLGFPSMFSPKKDFAIMFSLSSSIFLLFSMSKRKTAGRPYQQEQLLHEIRS